MEAGKGGWKLSNFNIVNNGTISFAVDFIIVLLMIKYLLSKLLWKCEGRMGISENHHRMWAFSFTCWVWGEPQPLKIF